MSRAPSPQAVPRELAGEPLDAVVRAVFGTSWGKARSWIASGKVFVDGAPVTDALRRIGGAAAIELRMNAPRPRTQELARDRFLHVDAHVVVVSKPAGVSTIPYDDAESGTLDELVRAHLARTSPDARGRPALGVVHRLDKETSGVIVFTRTWLAKKSLTQQFRDHTVHRRYLAIAHGAVRAQTIRSHLVEDRGDGLRGTSNRRGGRADAAGQLAITHIEPIERLEGATLVACRLETGRTHQIRIHLSEAGHPLVGERVYIRRFPEERRIAAPRMMLHAAELGFEHPASHLPVQWSEAPPDDFEETRRRLGGRRG